MESDKWGNLDEEQEIQMLKVSTGKSSFAYVQMVRPHGVGQVNNS